MNKRRYLLLASLLVTTMLAASVPAPSIASPLAGAWISCQNGAKDLPGNGEGLVCQNN